MAVQRDAGGVGARAKGKARRKRRPRPPWGSLLGGKPIERQAWVFNQKLDLGDDLVLQLQHMSMLKLKHYYGIFGGDFDYPIKGVGPSDWVPWYRLALAIALELDDSLNSSTLNRVVRRHRAGVV